MWNEIGKVVFVRGMMEKVYPIYDNTDVTFRGVRINGRRPSEYRIERSVYGVVPNEEDMEKMLKIAELYKELSSEDSRKYIVNASL